MNSFVHWFIVLTNRSLSGTRLPLAAKFKQGCRIMADTPVASIRTFTSIWINWTGGMLSVQPF
jgi:hypothetical protein